MNAFEIIASIPAKACNWAGLRAAIRAEYVAVCDPTEFDGTLTLCRFDAAVGLREIRFECGAMVNCIVDKKSVARRTISQISPETLAWGGFLSADVSHITEVSQENEAAAIEDIAALVAQFRTGRNQ